MRWQILKLQSISLKCTKLKCAVRLLGVGGFLLASGACVERPTNVDSRNSALETSDGISATSDFGKVFAPPGTVGGEPFAVQIRAPRSALAPSAAAPYGAEATEIGIEVEVTGKTNSTARLTQPIEVSLKKVIAAGRLAGLLLVADDGLALLITADALTGSDEWLSFKTTIPKFSVWLVYYDPEKAAARTSSSIPAEERQVASRPRHGLWQQV